MSTKPGDPYLNGRDAPSQPGDEVVGGWSREQLEKMDVRFRSRLERAIANGREHAPMTALHLTDRPSCRRWRGGCAESARAEAREVT